ncbi:uncharacterized protein LOC131298779 [Rhododendron vialii]|uniref:uncharacterized protein LOC131298779 n=1 Tax=Rhododendron vialii TaxID=182163 RepID=UPI00265D7C24|nr:uncharacterized protein LOC131298779 [Rhododendron vialii]
MYSISCHGIYITNHRNTLLHSNLMQQIQLSIPDSLKPQRNKCYEVVWTISPTGAYTTKHMWEAIRHKDPKAPWASLVWSSNNVSKWSFILWLACLKRLTTKERLHKWGMKIEPGCVLCSQCGETLQHLFFECGFSSSIWEVILHRFQIHRGVEAWNMEVAWATSFCQGKSFHSMLFKLAFAAGVYFLWTERNSIIFGGRPRSANEVLAHLDESIILGSTSQTHLRIKGFVANGISQVESLEMLPRNFVLSLFLQM